MTVGCFDVLRRLVSFINLKADLSSATLSKPKAQQLSRFVLLISLNIGRDDLLIVIRENNLYNDNKDVLVVKQSNYLNVAKFSL
ncbi:hypothetical protein T4D_13033 [Trichinella pseudospiralis]|uniref:Uncharacterized protein n=1 Tax=Trichinella pseudospiralis TaxID=6337 RepID=A0A0V1FAB7_TRIPS|nr:hypothetical protein T4D_13033 [Trichinella pseudospiralis]